MQSLSLLWSLDCVYLQYGLRADWHVSIILTAKQLSKALKHQLQLGVAQ